ncbi:MAG TPA: hypothetical protein VGL81_27305 [Polyangiaceae bacterium]|jgi:hypothetical protein
MTRRSWGLFVSAVLVALLVLGGTARADVGPKPPVVVWPTLTPAGDAPSATPLHRPLPTEKPLFERAQELDTTLRDAVQDLGYTLFVADPGPAQGRTRDEDLIERAAGAPGGAPRAEGEAGTWVVSPRIEPAGGSTFVVRIVAVPPRGRELRVRVETVAAESVGVRGLVMLRDLLTPEAAAAAEIEQERREAGRGTAQGVMTPLRSQGRAVLAVNGGAFGVFTAFSLENAASGTSDPRVLYPLLAVGTGIGVGAALLVADEWDVTTGDAWYLSAGAGWGSASGFLIAAGRSVQPVTDRYSWGVGGGLVGLGLATVALTRASMDDGDATLTHSGGALGLLLGGTVDWLARGTTTVTPYTGMGYGSAIGLVGAGFLATQVTVSPSRVLLIDLGAGGGALVGAAAASPLIFQQGSFFQSPNQGQAGRRGWLSVTLGGAVAGGGLAWWLTRSVDKAGGPRGTGTGFPGMPSAGVIGSSVTRSGEVPVYGVTWGGEL